MKDDQLIGTCVWPCLCCYSVSLSRLCVCLVFNPYIIHITVCGYLCCFYIWQTLLQICQEMSFHQGCYSPVSVSLLFLCTCCWLEAGYVDNPNPQKSWRHTKRAGTQVNPRQGVTELRNQFLSSSAVCVWMSDLWEFPSGCHVLTYICANCRLWGSNYFPLAECECRKKGWVVCTQHMLTLRLRLYLYNRLGNVIQSLLNWLNLALAWTYSGLWKCHVMLWQADRRTPK